jgi:hypothetical protein
MTYLDDYLAEQYTIESLMNEWHEVQDNIDVLDGRLAEIKAKVLKLVEQMPDQMYETDRGFVTITKPTTTRKYNTKAVDNLIMFLIQKNQGGIANELVNCQEELQRSGYLMYRKTKEK